MAEINPLTARNDTRCVIPLALFILLLFTARASAQTTPIGPGLRSKVTDLIEEILESEVELNVQLRRSKVIRMKHDIFRAAVADPSLVEIVAFGSREIEIIGKETGATTLTLWLGTQNQPRILSILINVTRDELVENRRRLEYGELQQMINEMFPDSKVQLVPIADKLIVRGQARDEQESVQIMALLRKHTGAATSNGLGGMIGARTNEGAAAEPFPDAVTLPQASIISMLTTPGEKQVMLKVRIAELKRSAVRRLGADFDFKVGDFFMRSILAGGGNLLTTGTFDSDSFNLVLNAVSATGNGKILAEPNLVVISGQPATFLAGGEFAVPTVVGIGGAQAATTQFKGFGTQLSFTPTVLDKDRIRLIVAPTFSTLNTTNTVNGVFGLDTRSVTTTVELREGQVLAIAGLLQEQQRGDESRVPGFGDVGLLKPLFQNKSLTRDETELIVLVSPELVHPMDPDQAPAILPGMEMTEPDDIDFFLYGHIEGRPECHHRSTVWPLYRDRLHKCSEGQTGNNYQHTDEYYIYGPHGYSE